MESNHEIRSDHAIERRVSQSVELGLRQRNGDEASTTATAAAAAEVRRFSAVTDPKDRPNAAPTEGGAVVAGTCPAR